jgi:opacity protein-like surface antigen
MTRTATKLLVTCAAAATLLGGVAQAQTAPPPRQVPSAAQPNAGQRLDRYIEGIGGWTFGEKGSQFFGAEGGFTWKPNVHVFIEGGRVNNAGGSAIRDAAELLGEGLSRIQSGVSVKAEQPTIFVSGGLRYSAPFSGSRAQPFFIVGGGISRVKQDVKVTVAGADVTSTLANLGVVLGSDLSGSFTRPHVVFGGGFTIAVHRNAFAEVSYRLMRIFAEDSGITINRAGLGFGMRF